jgi:hypothetical protein
MGTYFMVSLILLEHILKCWIVHYFFFNRNKIILTAEKSYIHVWKVGSLNFLMVLKSSRL